MKNESMTKSALTERSEQIRAAYEILGYAGDQDVLHWLEEADQDAGLSKRILTMTKNGKTLFLSASDACSQLQKVREILDEFEALLK